MSKLHKTPNPKYTYTYISDSKLTTVILTFNKENSQNVIYLNEIMYKKKKTQKINIDTCVFFNVLSKIFIFIYVKKALTY